MMSTVTFTPPKQWEDWCYWVLGIWMLLSPWILLFEKDSVATRNAVIVGLLIVLTEAVTLSIFRVWEEWVNVALGAWLAISPWVLPITDSSARTNFVIVGLLVAGLALFEVWEVSRRPDSARAGD